MPSARSRCTVLAWTTLLLAFCFSTQARSDDLGKEVFTSIAQPSCMLCHVLKAAGASGEIGPDLDDLKPTEERVRTAVAKGVGVMPAFSDTLSRKQIDAVAKYVAKATR